MKELLIIIVFAAQIFLSCGTKKEAEKPPVKSAKLKVATYNVNYMTAGYAGIKKAISDIKPNIIALQEVLLKQGTDYAKKLSEDLNYNHASSLPYVSFDNTRWVLSFLSAYPIINIDQTKLGYSRRALKVIIDFEGKKLALITMHLTPFTWSDSNLLQANKNMSKLRQKEIADLVTWIGTPGLPVIILGDFNSLPFMGELSPILELGYRDVYNEIENSIEGSFPLQKWVKASVTKALPGYPIPDTIKLDYILISQKIKALKLDILNTKASDHLPLFAELLID